MGKRKKKFKFKDGPSVHGKDTESVLPLDTDSSCESIDSTLSVDTRECARTDTDVLHEIRQAETNLRNNLMLKVDQVMVYIMIL